MEIWATSEASEPDDEVTTPSVQGGRERGLILHKLLEEVLTGEYGGRRRSPDWAGVCSHWSAWQARGR